MIPDLFPGSRTHLLVLLFPEILSRLNWSLRSGLTCGHVVTEGSELKPRQYNACIRRVRVSNTARTLCGPSLRSGRGAGLSTAVITALNRGLLRFTCCVTAFASVYLARCVAAHFSLILHPRSNQYK